jgi:hypothetical protein
LYPYTRICRSNAARPDLDPDKTGKTGELILGILKIAREGKEIPPVADGTGGEIDKLTLLQQVQFGHCEEAKPTRQSR